MYLIYVDSPFHDFYDFCNVYFRCFYSPNGPSLKIDPANAVTNFDFTLYGHCK